MTIVRDEDAAEQIYSDVMLRLWFMEGELQHIINLRQYIYTAIRNTAFNYLKKLSRTDFTELESIELSASTGETPEKVLLEAEFQQIKERAVSSLPTQCQLVYRLIKESGFNYQQTADILEISKNTVERHMGIALKKIVSALKPYVSR